MSTALGLGVNIIISQGGAVVFPSGILGKAPIMVYYDSAFAAGRDPLPSPIWTTVL